jgi:intergrase/recombinase
MTDARSTLRQAAEYLSENGWTQGKLLEKIDGKQAACAMGAIRVVSGPSELASTRGEKSEAAYRLLSGYLDEKGVLPADEAALHPIARWNDRMERTAEDVILAMKDAAGGE